MLWPALALVLVWAFTSHLLAATATWTGNGDGTLWSDKNNWSPTAVPAAGSDVTIPAVNSNTVQITSAAGTIAIKSLAASQPLNLSGGTLQVSTTIQLSRDLTLSGGTVTGGTIIGTGGARVVLTRGGGTVAGGATIDASMVVDGTQEQSYPYSQLTVTGGLTLNGMLNLGKANGSTEGHVTFAGSGNQTLTGSGTVNFGNSTANSIIENTGNSGTGTLTIDAGIKINGGSGTIAGNNSYLATESVLYLGALSIPSGQSIVLGGINWFNKGSLNLTGAKVTLAGAFTTDSLDAQGVFNATGAVVSVTGSIANAGKTLLLSALRGNWSLAGATITGGTITSTGGAKLTLTRSGGTLAGGVTIDSSVVIDGTQEQSYPDSQLTVAGGLTLNGTLNLGKADGTTDGQVTFAGSGNQTLTGSGTVNFGNSTANSIIENTGNSGTGTLTIDTNIKINGGSGTIAGNNSYLATESVLYLGTLNIPSGQSIVLGGINWLNKGTLNLAGAKITLAGTFTTDSLDAQAFFNATGAAVSVTGTLANAGKTLLLSALRGNWSLAGATITGGTITSTGGARLTLTRSGGTLAGGVTVDSSVVIDGTQEQSYPDSQLTVTGGLTLNGTLNLGKADGSTNGQVTFAGSGNQTLTGSGTVNFGNSTGNSIIENTGNSGTGTLTIDAGIKINGGSGTIGGNNSYLATESVIYLGTLNIAAAQNFVLGGLNWVNKGTLNLAGAKITLAGAFTTDSLDSQGVFNATGAAVSVTGSIANAGKTLLLSAHRGDWSLAGATITGGTITSTGGAKLTLTRSGGTLAGGVTVDSSVVIDGTQEQSYPYSQLTVTGGLTLNGTLNLGKADGSTNGQVTFAGSGNQTLTGSGTANFGNSTGNSIIENTGNSGTGTLTIDAGIKINGGSGTIAGNNSYLATESVLYLGTVNIPSGQSIVLGGINWLNKGTLNLAGALVTLAGTFTTDSLDAQGSFNASGAAVSVTGSMANAGKTLLLSAQRGNWSLSGAKITGGTITSTGGARLTLTRSGGALAGGVTIDSSVVIDGTQEQSYPDSQLTVSGGLTLNGVLNLGKADGSTFGQVTFTGAGNQTLTGSGTINLGNSTGNSIIENLGNSGVGALTIDDGLTINGGSGTIGGNNSYQAVEAVIHKEAIYATVNGKAITLTNYGNSAIACQSTLAAQNGGILSLGAPVDLSAQKMFICDANSAIFFGSDVLGSTAALTSGSLMGTITFNGSGTAAVPQRLETFNADQGANNAGFGQSLAFGRFVLAGNTYVLLVNLSTDAPGAAAEATYASTVAVSAGSTLDLGATHLYAHDVQVSGTVNHGPVTQVVNATVNWTGLGDGISWSDPKNWSGNLLPGATSDVTIGVLANDPTIQITAAAGMIKINSLNTSAPLNLTGGILQVATNVQTSRNITLSGGTIRSSTVNTSGSTALILTTVGGTLDGVTLNTNLDLTANSAQASVVNGLVLNGTATFGNSPRLYFTGSQTLGGSGTVYFPPGSYGALVASTDGMTLTIGAGVTVRGGCPNQYYASIGYSPAYGGPGNVSLNLLGTINADTAGASIYLGAHGTGTLTNPGTINLSNGGSVYLDGNFTRASLGTINRTGSGTVYLVGTLDNTAKTLTLDDSTGPWLLAGGAVKGGTVAASGSAALVLTSAGGTLDGVTLNSDLDVTASSANATILNNLSLNGTATFGNSTRLNFNGSQTLGGNGTVYFPPSSYAGLLASQDGMTLTIGAGITVHGGSTNGNYAAIGYSPYLGGGNNVSLHLLGTVNADAAAASIYLGAHGTGMLTNSGAINLTNGGSVYLDGNFTRTSLGTINRSGSGLVNIAGTLDNRNTTLILDATTGSWELAGGTIKGGSVTASGGTALVLTPAGGTLDGVTLNSDLDLTTNSAGATILDGLVLNGTATMGPRTQLDFNGTQTLSGTGTVVFSSAYYNGLVAVTDGMTLTIGSSITVRGGSTNGYYAAIGRSPNYFGGGNNVSLNLLGAISADTAGASIYLGAHGTGSLTNSGTISLSNGGSVYLDGNFTRTSLGALTRSGSGMVNIAGTLDNRNTTLTLDATTGSWGLAGGTIKGGTVAASGGATLMLTGAGGTLDGVTLNSDLDLTADYANATILNGLVLNGTATLGNFTHLDFTNSQALTGAGTVVFQTARYSALVAKSDGMTLTIGAGITVHGGSSSGYYAAIGYSPSYFGGGSNVSLNLLGTIDADTAGVSIYLGARGTGTLTNSGTINLSNGGGISLDGSFTRASLGAINRSGGGIVTIAGVLDNTGQTLTLNSATGSWLLAGGTIKGGTVASSGGAALVLTSIGCTLDGVILNTDLDLTASSASATVLHGLTLNGKATLGPQAILYFSGTQTLTGTGTVLFQSGSYNGLVAYTDGTTLTIDPGIAVHGGSGSPFSVIGYSPYVGGGANVSLNLRGPVTADANGKIILVSSNGSGTLAATGALGAAGGGTLSVSTPLALNTPGSLKVDASSALLLYGDLVGSAAAGAAGNLRGSATFTGAGTAATPQRLEAMAADQGANNTGFNQGYTFGKLILANNTRVELVNLSDNAPGAGAEAVYADTVVVPAGSTLDLNHLHLYAHNVQVSGTVVNGPISQVVAVTVTWTGAGDGKTWGDKNNWSGSQLPGAISDVTIPAISAQTVVIDGTAGIVQINSLATSMPVSLATGGTLRVSNPVVLSQNLTLAGGTLDGVSLDSDNVSSLVLTNAGGTLNSVTITPGAAVDGTQASCYAYVTGGLVLNGNAVLGAADGSTFAQLYFTGSQTLSGSGQVSFGNSPGNGLYERTAGSGTLTIAAGLTIQGGSGAIGAYGTAGGVESLINSGTISVPAGQSLAIGGANWSNTGSINVQAVTATLLGSFKLADLGSVQRTGATVLLAGTLDNTGAVLALDNSSGAWVLAGGTIHGGAISTSAAGLFSAANGILDGVILDSDCTFSGGVVTAANGLTLNGARITLSDAGGSATLKFLGSQSLGGSGEVIFAGAGSNNTLAVQGGGALASAATLTIGPGILLHGAQGGSLQAVYSSDAISLQGTISSETAGKTIHLAGGSFTDLGTVTASNGGAFDIAASFTMVSPGSINLPPNSALQLTGDLLDRVTGAAGDRIQGPITVNGSGSLAAPQLLEARSQDLGPVTAGFASNLALGRLNVGNNTRLQLVDRTKNSGGASPEAVYATSVVVSAGAVLDLNGLQLYTHSLQIGGTVTGGSVTQVPDPVLLRLQTGLDPAAAVLNPITHRLYVANRGDNTVTVVDGATGDLQTVAVHGAPSALAVDAERNLIYVADRGANDVAVIDGATNATSFVAVGRSPQALAFDSQGNYLYVANGDDNNVMVIDGSGFRNVGTLAVGVNPSALVVDVATDQIYVANFGTAGSPSPASVINGSSHAVSSVAAGAGSAAIAVNAATNKVYVANQGSNTVTVFDGSNNSSQTVPVGAQPTAITVDPVSNRIYVANRGDNTITVINGATNAAASLAVDLAPAALSVNSRTNRIYVANSGASSLSVIDGATGTVSQLDAGLHPVALGIDPLTERIYAVSSGDSAVSVLSGAAYRPSTFSIGQAPGAVAINPVTGKAYVVNSGSNTVTVTDGGPNAERTIVCGQHPVAVAVNSVTNRIYVANEQSGTVTQIDGATNTPSAIAVGLNPCALAVDPVANRVYVANRGSNTVTSIDGATGSTTTLSLNGGLAPAGVAVSSATGRVYITCSGNSTLVVVDPAANQTFKLAVGANPQAVAVNSATNMVYVANRDSASVSAIDGLTGIGGAIAAPAGATPAAIAINFTTNQIYVSGGESGNGSVMVIDGATNTASFVVAGAAPAALAIDQARNKVYVANTAGHELTVLDGATNSTSVLPVAALPQAVAFNPVSGQLFTASAGTPAGAGGVGTVFDTNFAGANRLAVSFDGLPGNVARASATAIGLSARSYYAPEAPGIRQIYYQFDTVSGPWLASSNNWSANLAPLVNLPLGSHTLYAFATDGQEGTSVDTGSGASAICGQLAAYPLVATGGGSFSFISATVTVHNSDPVVSVAVQRDFSGAAAIDFQTVAGTAAGGVNFTPVHGTLRFSASDATATFSVPLINQGAGDSLSYFTLQLLHPTGANNVGAMGSETVFILNDNISADLALSKFTPLPASAAPLANVSITATLDPAAGQWRLFGELDWRDSGTTAAGLTASAYALEFRPVQGYSTPPFQFFTVASGQNAHRTATYKQDANAPTGSLQVNLSPANTGGWNLLGEKDPRPSGSLASGLTVGSYLVEFAAVAGLVTPESREVIVSTGQTAVVTATYYVDEAPAVEPPVLVDGLMPPDARIGVATAFLGQLQTDSGFGTGFVPLDRIVATAAHVLFDDGTLSYAQGVRWFFQRDRGVYQAPAQIPRGSYLLSGYAAQRIADHSPGVSTTASQQLDAAAMYFLEPAARGGQSGYLASNSENNPWLTNVPASILRPKFIAGYPVSGGGIDPATKGRPYVTPLITDAFDSVTSGLFKTDALASRPGNSGGPLLVGYDDSSNFRTYYPAAIYLGGTAQTVVRAIDSQVIDLFNRAEGSANGGAPQTGNGVVRIDNGPSGTIQFAAGTVNILLQPPDAVAAARWGFAPDAPSRRSGEQSLNVPPGGYQIIFGPVPGYDAPAPLTVTVLAGQQTTQVALYQPTQPAITSASSTSGVRGASFSFQVTGTPAPTSYSADALPDGLKIDPRTGLISGTPVKAGSFPVTLHVTNSRGVSDPAMLEIYILAPGELTVAVLPAAPPLAGSVSAGFLGKTTRAAGSSIDLLATPAPGFVFDHWSRVEPDQTRKVVGHYAAYSFTMPNNLSLEANFVPNPFLRSPGGVLPVVVGSYRGLASDNGSHGELAVEVTAKASFTGSFSLGVQRYSLHGVLNGDGSYAGLVPGAKGQLPLRLNLQLDVSGPSQTLTGRAAVGDAVLSLLANRNLYSTGAPAAPQALGRKTGAKYMISFLHPAGAGVPPTDGSGLLVVSPNGALRFTGKLGDGANASHATTLGQHGEWPLYALPYKAGGYFTGPLIIDPAGVHAVTGQVDWQKPAPNGFTTSVAAHGAPAGQ